MQQPSLQRDHAARSFNSPLQADLARQLEIKQLIRFPANTPSRPLCDRQIYKRFMEKEAREWRQIYKVRNPRAHALLHVRGVWKGWGGG